MRISVFAANQRLVFATNSCEQPKAFGRVQRYSRQKIVVHKVLKRGG